MYVYIQSNHVEYASDKVSCFNHTNSIFYNKCVVIRTSNTAVLARRAWQWRWRKWWSGWRIRPNCWLMGWSITHASLIWHPNFVDWFNMFAFIFLPSMYVYFICWAFSSFAIVHFLTVFQLKLERKGCDISFDNRSLILERRAVNRTTQNMW